MRTTLALCLIAGLALPVAAQEGNRPVIVAPFEVLDSHPGCAGPDKIAFQVAFDVKGAKARFGISGQDKESARTCAIKTRRGSQVMEIPIPCPDVEVPVLEAAGALDDLPRAADLSGKIVACMGLTEISFVEASWTMRIGGAVDVFEASGDLSSPGLTVVFSGPIGQSSGAEQPAPDGAAPVLAVLWDGVDVAVRSKPDLAVEVSTYFALAPKDVTQNFCGGAGCTSYASDLPWVVKAMGGRGVRDIVDFVEGK